MVGSVELSGLRERGGEGKRKMEVGGMKEGEG